MMSESSDQKMGGPADATTEVDLSEPSGRPESAPATTEAASSSQSGGWGSWGFSKLTQMTDSVKKLAVGESSNDTSSILDGLKAEKMSKEGNLDHLQLPKPPTEDSYGSSPFDLGFKMVSKISSALEKAEEKMEEKFLSFSEKAVQDNRVQKAGMYLEKFKQNTVESVTAVAGRIRPEGMGVVPPPSLPSKTQNTNTTPPPVQETPVQQVDVPVAKAEPVKEETKNEEVPTESAAQGANSTSETKEPVDDSAKEAETSKDVEVPKEGNASMEVETAAPEPAVEEATAHVEEEKEPAAEEVVTTDAAPTLTEPVASEAEKQDEAPEEAPEETWEEWHKRVVPYTSKVDYDAAKNNFTRKLAVEKAKLDDAAKALVRDITTVTSEKFPGEFLDDEDTDKTMSDQFEKSTRQSVSCASAKSRVSEYLNSSDESNATERLEQMKSGAVSSLLEIRDSIVEDLVQISEDISNKTFESVDEVKIAVEDCYVAGLLLRNVLVELTSIYVDGVKKLGKLAGIVDDDIQPHFLDIYLESSNQISIIAEVLKEVVGPALVLATVRLPGSN